MKLKRYSAIIILVVIFLMIFPSSVPAQDKDLVYLLDRITDRISSYPENKNWKHTCITKDITMNKQWQPKKTTITKSIETVIDGVPNGEILEVLEIENGVTKDITQKKLKDIKDLEEKAKKNRAKEKPQNVYNDMINSLLPFAKDKREKYIFKKLDDSVIESTPVFLIEAKAIEKDENLYEGNYYIDKTTFDVLKIQIKPSKNPMFVDEMEMEVSFLVLPEGGLVVKHSKIRGSAGILGMHIRHITEEDYSDFEILPATTH